MSVCLIAANNKIYPRCVISFYLHVRDIPDIEYHSAVSAKILIRSSLDEFSVRFISKGDTAFQHACEGPETNGQSHDSKDWDVMEYFLFVLNFLKERQLLISKGDDSI